MAHNTILHIYCHKPNRLRHENSFIGVTNCIAAGISEVAVHDLVCCGVKMSCHHFAAPSMIAAYTQHRTQSRVLIIFKSHHPTQDKIQVRYYPTQDIIQQIVIQEKTKYLATMKLNSAILLLTVLSFSADHVCEFCVPYLCMDIYMRLNDVDTSIVHLPIS